MNLNTHYSDYNILNIDGISQKTILCYNLHVFREDELSDLYLTAWEKTMNSFKKGFADGLPIGLGYLSVSFSCNESGP